MRPRLLPVLLLSGCAVDCTDRDWHARGYRDGFGGHPTQVVRLQQQCGMPEAEYLKGWAAGHDEWDRLIGSRQNSQR